MMHKITDLIEPDNGCEGYLPGQEPMVTLTLDDGRVIKVPDMLAYENNWDIGQRMSEQDIARFEKQGG